MGFQGSVESFSLADVFQNLAMNQQTGTLRIVAPDGKERHIFFDAGQVKNLSRGTQIPLVLGEMLVGRSISSPEQVEEALAAQKERRKPLGECMLELGFLDRDRLEAVLKHQIGEELYELFGWEKANFEFTEGPANPQLFVDRGLGSPSLPISSLIMEAARRVDEVERLREQIPSFKEIYVVDKDVREALESGALETDAIERRVITLVDGKRDVDDLIADSFLFRFEVLSTLAGFLQSSLVRPAKLEELQAATPELREAGDKGRLCKNLERRLALGDDTGDVRRELADVLAASEQAEKAAIHYSVLADGEQKAGNEDGAVDLYRKILQVLPHHLPSRERLGTIYARRGQLREAMVQFQEVIQAHQRAQNFASARRVAQQALEIEPTAHDIRRELVQILVDEGDKAAAARECEVLGDMLARQGQSREAAECYRRAIQVMPGLAHLKKKLANVMLTQEDRRARTKRTLIVTVSVLAVLAIGGALGLREFNLYTTWQRTREQVKLLQGTAAEFEAQERFKDAADKYEDAIRRIASSEMKDTFAPITRVNDEARALHNKLENARNAAVQKHDVMAASEQKNSKEVLDQGRALWKADDLFAAIAKFDEVLSNQFAPEEVRTEAAELKEKTEAKATDYKAGIARMKKPPRESFNGVQEEYRFKLAFFERFGKVPELSKEKLELPVLVTLKNVDRVLVYKDGTFLGPASKGAENVFRYDRAEAKRFEFRKEGYKTEFRLVREMDVEATVSLQREPAFVARLPVKPSGGAVYDGKDIWVGTVEGGLLQLTPGPKGLTAAWEFKLPGGGGLDKEVFGNVVVQTVGGKKLLLYSTKAGDRVAVEPGNEKPALFGKSKDRSVLETPARIQHLPLAGDQLFFLIPRDRRLEGYRAEQDIPLWSRGSEELPKAITCGPLLIRQEELLVVGCADGNLYGLSLRDGTRQRVWTTRGQAIAGGPLLIRNLLVACGREGSVFFFDLKGGGELNTESIPGSVYADPIVQRQMLFVGASLPDGLFAIDLDTQRLRFAYTGEQIDGGITTTPAVVGDFVYYGTERGHFYALKYDGQGYEQKWDYRAPDGARMVCSPVAIGTRAFFFCADGRVYVFDD
ncbi:MAG: hypothetical protein AMXMBFR7_03650 [Planctomycetota bacterium]